jgi:hypothetical protein
MTSDGSNAPLGPGGELDVDVDVERRRGKTAHQGGYIVGDTASRQFQILRSDPLYGNVGCWALAVSTRNIEEVHERAKARSVPVTAIKWYDYNERDALLAFFAEVGGVMFEVIKVEPRFPRPEVTTTRIHATPTA